MHWGMLIKEGKLEKEIKVYAVRDCIKEKKKK